jgi:hypothetical protein
LPAMLRVIDLGVDFDFALKESFRTQHHQPLLSNGLSDSESVLDAIVKS